MKNYNYTGIITGNSSWINFMPAVTISMQKNKTKNVSSMETEILEQPSIIEKLTKKYITPEKYILINLPLNIKKVVLIASGSSYHCAYITAELLKEIAKCDAESIYASEFSPTSALNIDKETLFIFISQSGETSDTLEALKHISKQTNKTLCVTNNEDSTIWQLSNYKVLTEAGKEYSIASTKAMSAQLFCLYLITLKILYSRNEDIKNEITDIHNLPKFLNNILEDTQQIKTVAKKLSKYPNISILGSRAFYALAKEGALKIKETSYINTTAYPQGEFMHGHVAILNQKSALISLVDKKTEDLCVKNLEKIKKDYKPFVLAISNKESEDRINDVSSCNIKLDAETKIFSLFGGLIILQLLALEMAKHLKRDIDRPIGLKKVVIN